MFLFKGTLFSIHYELTQDKCFLPKAYLNRQYFKSVLSAIFKQEKKKKRQPQMHKNEKDSTVLWFRLILKGHHLI